MKIIAIKNNIINGSRDRNLPILLLNLFFIFKIIKGLLSMLFVALMPSLITSDSINMVLNFMNFYRWNTTDGILSMALYRQCCDANAVANN